MSDLLISAEESKLARKLLRLFQSNDRNVFFLYIEKDIKHGEGSEAVVEFLSCQCL